MVVFSIALHAVALAVVLIDPDSWKWSVAAIVANHALLFVLAFVPRGRLLGPNLSRLPVAAARAKCIAVTIDEPSMVSTPAFHILTRLLHTRGTCRPLCISVM